MKVNTKNRGYVIFYAAVTSAVFTGAIMALYKATEPTAERTALVFEKKSIVELFSLGDVGEMSDKEILETYDRHVRRGRTVTDPVSGESFELITAWRFEDGKERLIGYAFPISGVGFWARIEGLLAVTPDLSRTIGIVFLRHSETPGLGGRIMERQFREPFFRGLNVAPPPAGQSYLEITRGEPAPGRGDRHVEAITGATGTSTAVSDFLNERLEQFRRAMKNAGMLNERPADH